MKEKSISFHEVEIKFLVRAKGIKENELTSKAEDAISEYFEEEDLEISINGIQYDVEGKPI